MSWTKLGQCLYAALGPTCIVCLEGGILILLGLLTPSKAGNEMGGSWMALLLLYVTPIAMLLTEILTTIIFLCVGVSKTSFWQITCIFAGITLLPFLFLIGICTGLVH